MADKNRDELAAFLHGYFPHRCGDAAAPYCVRESVGFADAVLANPDVMMAALLTVENYGHLWDLVANFGVTNRHEIGQRYLDRLEAAAKLMAEPGAVSTANPTDDEATR